MTEDLKKKENVEKAEVVNAEAMPEPQVANDEVMGAPDEAMPEPQTKEYVKYIRVKPKFKEMLENTIGTLGYNQNIGTPDTQIQVNKLFKIIEDFGDKMPINDMNQFIVLMSLAPWKIIHEFMAMIEKPELQAELWEIYEA
jgi:hypothetical protein